MNTLLLNFRKLKEFVFNKVDLMLLFYLLMILNYRYSFKIIALVVIYAYRPNFKFKKSKINAFFILVILLGFINLILSGNYSYNHILSLLSGTTIWVFCILILHQLTLFLKEVDIFKIINTIKVIVVINLLVSLAEIVKVMFIVGALNPYTQLTAPPYGIMSGDLIGGAFGLAHNVNTCISAMLFVFFLYRKNLLFSILTMIPLLMTSSNIAVIIVCFGLLFFILTSKDKILKYYSIFNLGIIFVFYFAINPHNFYETISVFNPKAKEEHFKKIDRNIFANKENENLRAFEIDSLSKSWGINELTIGKTSALNKIEQAKVASVNNLITQNKLATKKKNLLSSWSAKDQHIASRDLDPKFDYGNLKKFNIDSCPGVIISYSQTKDLLLGSSKNFLIGAGTNEFSSRLAFVNSKFFEDSRLLSLLPKYENKIFKENHKALYRYLQYAGEESHSIIHVPFSGYNQLFGEYGVIGFLGFVFLYLGYFISKRKSLTYGKFILILIIPLFAFDYWFERLSVMVLFEFIMLLDLKLNTKKEETKKLQNTK